MLRAGVVPDDGAGAAAARVGRGRRRRRSRSRSTSARAAPSTSPPSRATAPSSRRRRSRALFRCPRGVVHGAARRAARIKLAPAASRRPTRSWSEPQAGVRLHPLVGEGAARARLEAELPDRRSTSIVASAPRAPRRLDPRLRLFLRRRRSSPRGAASPEEHAAHRARASTSSSPGRRGGDRRPRPRRRPARRVTREPPRPPTSVVRCWPRRRCSISSPAQPTSTPRSSPARSASRASRSAACCSAPSSTRFRTQRGSAGADGWVARTLSYWLKGGRHEVLHLLRDADLRARPAPARRRPSATASSRRCSPTSSATTASGRSSTTGSTSTRTRRRPRSSSSFVAARTKRIRLGHGVTLLPYRYNHPIRIAERIATLDILSGGRVNWGSGKSSSLVEQHAFENDLKTLHDQWLEAIEMIPRMWSADVFSHEGRFFKMPPTQVIPKPVQTAAPADVRRLLQAGIGGRRRQARPRRAQLRLRHRRLPRPEGHGVPPRRRRRARRSGGRRTTGSPARRRRWCSTTTARPAAYGLRGARFFAESMARYYLSGHAADRQARRAARLPLRRRARRRAWPPATPPGSPVASIVGDPVAVRETRVALRRHRRRRAHPGHADGHGAARARHASRCAPSPRRSPRSFRDLRSLTRQSRVSLPPLPARLARRAGPWPAFT